jgi:hypothetical protein
VGYFKHKVDLFHKYYNWIELPWKKRDCVPLKSWKLFPLLQCIRNIKKIKLLSFKKFCTYCDSSQASLRQAISIFLFLKETAECKEWPKIQLERGHVSYTNAR